jgi:trk system potassium uptake protein TrkH
VSRYLAILNVLGPVVTAFGLSILLPLGISHALDDGAQLAYDEAAAIITALGAAMWLGTRRHKRELAVRDGFLFVALVWTVLPALGTLPLLLYLPGLSFTDAYFEAVSGLTASGATVLSGLDELPVSLNVWRALMVWLGGLGVVVLAVAILPLLGVGGAQIFKAELASPIKDAKLTPRIAETAKGLWLVYLLLTILCMLAYRLAGMSWMDALIHAFTTMGLGGFSSHDASFGYWDSPRIEAVAIVFMMIASINFTTHFAAFRRRSVRPYRSDPEARWVAFTLLAGALLVAVFLWVHGIYDTLAASLRYALFNVISIASTTGYANTDYALWPVFAPVWMLFLSCFTTSSGSTGAGIKMIRALILTKQSLREFTRILHPSAYVPLKVGGMKVENNLIFAVLAFMLIYGGTAVAMTLLLAASGLDIVTAFSAVMACINNMGPGLGAVGPASTYAVLTDFQTWVCTITMMLGRLELMTLLVVVTPGFWRK